MQGDSIRVYRHYVTQEHFNSTLSKFQIETFDQEYKLGIENFKNHVWYTLEKFNCHRYFF